MKKLSKLTLITAMLFLAAGVFGAFVITANVSAQELIEDDSAQTEESPEEEAQTEEQAQPEESEESTEESTETFNYVAQVGDSYTKMARKAVQTYGIDNEVSLSEAQIVFAETNITLVSGSSLLDLGQEVQIDKSVVQEWVEKAQELSDEEQSAWSQYVDNVNFDTNAVGEAVS